MIGIDETPHASCFEIIKYEKNCNLCKHIINTLNFRT